MKRAFLYVRVSTAEQARDGFSIDEQIDRLTTYCKACDYTIVKIYNDAGYSGANTDRPALRELISDAQNGFGDVVLVYKLDRLSRSQKDTLSLIEDCFLRNGVEFVSMTENFDTSSPFGRAMIGILSVFAQLEREQIRERMSLGKQGRAKSGLFHGGGNVPVGYEYHDGVLSVNEYEAMQIRMIFDLYSSGHAFKEIERILIQKGYQHKFGQWTAKRIRETLLNPLYCGLIRHHDDLYTGTHEAIISREQYDQCLRLYQRRDHTVHHRGKSLLSGLLYCRRCHARYSADSHVYNGRRYRYYACNSKRKQVRSMIRDPNCKNKTYKQEELDTMILDQIRSLSVDPDAVHQMIQSRQTDDDRKREKIISQEIARIASQRSRFLDLYGIGRFSVDELQAKIEPLDEQKKSLERELETIQKSAGMSENEALEMISSFADVIASGDQTALRNLVTALIERIEIDGDDIDIFWRF